MSQEIETLEEVKNPMIQQYLILSILTVMVGMFLFDLTVDAIGAQLDMQLLQLLQLERLNHGNEALGTR